MIKQQQEKKNMNKNDLIVNVKKITLRSTLIPFRYMYILPNNYCPRIWPEMCLYL